MEKVVMTDNLRLSVSDFIALTNQTLEYAYPAIEVEGEVSSFKVNQGKYVFFDLKDDHGSIGCFMSVYQLRHAIEDGMKIIVTAVPKLTPWGKFSLTVRSIQLSGEGSIKKNFELLKAKLEKEGLFSLDRKRVLPEIPSKIAVISSIQAAGYEDFIKIIEDRWGGLEIEVAHVQVQGVEAPEQIIKALKYFNMRDDLVEVIAIIRGGGSLEDLSTFNDEQLTREVASSRIPVLTGIGHDKDISLTDLASDIMASTPSNAAQILVPDRNEYIRTMYAKVSSVISKTDQAVDNKLIDLSNKMDNVYKNIVDRHQKYEINLENMRRVLSELDPRRVLERGYSIVRGDYKIGSTLEIEKVDKIIKAEVKEVYEK